MVARRFSLLPSHASRVDHMLNRLAIIPQCPRAIPGCQVFGWVSPNIGLEQYPCRSSIGRAAPARSL